MKDLNLDIKVSTVGEDDRADLEGKIVTYEYGDGSTIPVVVVGVNRSVGFTLVEANNKDHYIVCIKGPVLPDNDLYKLQDYNELFDVFVQMVENGRCIAEDLQLIAYGHTSAASGPSARDCAYNQ